MKRTVLVTGANRGSGLAITRELAELGNSVLLGARDGEAGEDTALEYATRGIRSNAVCPGTIETPMIAAIMAQESLSMPPSTASTGPVVRWTCWLITPECYTRSRCSN